MKSFITQIPALLLCVFFTQCQSSRPYKSQPANGSEITEPGFTEINLVAYHINDSITSVFSEIKNDNLLYKRPDTTRAFYAELKITYKLTTEMNTRKVEDYGSFYIQDRSENEQLEVRSLFTQFPIRAAHGYDYELDLEVLDLNRKVKYYNTLSVQKSYPFSSQNFLVTKNDSVVFRNYFMAKDSIVVELTNPYVKSLTIDCFLKDFGPAAPPFSTKTAQEFKLKPDSFFNVSVINKQFAFVMPVKGFYHVGKDSAVKEGLSLFTFDKAFPGLGSTDEMINCTRYIMSREEFEDCKGATDKKAAIDRFWLGIGGSNERARELIRRYYSRVKEANKNYSSYTEGWKTDRGMIFIVFGQPTNIYRSRRDEVWVYGNEANPGSLRFIFNKTKSPYSDNDYMMERSQYYKDSWHRAVDYWREGNI
jgi:GWxTD domain-containing protein